MVVLLLAAAWRMGMFDRVRLDVGGILLPALGVIALAALVGVVARVTNRRGSGSGTELRPPTSSRPRSGPDPVSTLEQATREGAEPYTGEVESVGPPQAASDVLISVSAPASVAPGASFVARFAAYTPELQEETLKLLRQLSGGAEVYENVRESRWAVGTKVTVRLTSRGLKVDPAEQTFTWRGTRNLLDFVVEVPAEAAVKQTVLRFEVLVAGFDMAPIALPLAIGEGAGERETSTVEPARTAFASYAHQDKERVLDRVAAVRIAAGLDVFLDCLSLRPNEKWKPELERRIIDSDLFLLFWSQAAKESPWVTWEWKTAWEKKPHERFQLQPLAWADPPPEWADLQADDVLMSLRELEERRRTAPSTASRE
ncbi:MAG TPA: toll/interleukin-1 receptor domain-containing protein [Longimicrobium sp.]|nr:toll/interleukin-1 receptor domain-containing protein [Longimicrobium sp.]